MSKLHPELFNLSTKRKKWTSVVVSAVCMEVLANEWRYGGICDSSRGAGGVCGVICMDVMVMDLGLCSSGDGCGFLTYRFCGGDAFTGGGGGGVILCCCRHSSGVSSGSCGDCGRG